MKYSWLAISYVSSVHHSSCFICVYIFFQILFHNKLLHDIEYSSLCCTISCYRFCYIKLVCFIICIPCVSDSIEYLSLTFHGASQMVLVVKNQPACRTCKTHGFDPWIRKIPWRRAWWSTPAFPPGESHGQRSLVGYSLWGRIDSDMTEATYLTYMTYFTKHNTT